MASDVSYSSAVALAGRICRGDSSPVDILETFLDRIDARDGDLNAFVTVADERARERAREAERAIEAGEDLGPLCGVPVAVKDLIDTADLKTTYGSTLFAEHVPNESDVVVRRLEAAGAIVVGKTNTPEFGRKPMTTNRLFGATGNPWDREKTAGGSSGGSAAALADGLVPLALGTDAAGSIRIPSSACGTFGLVPDFGRVPHGNSRTDAFVNVQPYGYVGPMSRTVADTALALDVLAGPHPADPYSLPERSAADSYLNAVQSAGDDRSTDRALEGISVAYSPDLSIGRFDEAIEATAADAAATFAAAGADVTRVERVFEPSWGTLFDALSTILEVRYAGLYDDLRRNAGVNPLDPKAGVTDAVRSRIEKATEVSALEFKRAERVRTTAYDTIQDLLRRYDLLCTPLITIILFEKNTEPIQIGAEDIHPLHGWHLAWPFNLTGNPAASIPAGFVDDLPVGLQLVGPRLGDEAVIRASAVYERERPWHDAYPPR